MADFGTNGLKLQGNTGAGTDASPTWTDVLFGTANNELRAGLSSGAQTTSTSSALWPSMLRPSSGTALIDRLYQFTADTTGYQIATYDGTGAHYNQFRINWDNSGTYAASPLISAWKDSTLPAASPGTQPSPSSGGDGSSVINGSSDTSNASYLKGTVYGFGVTAGGSADNPGSNMGTTPSVTNGSAGAVTSTTGAWTAWQSLQAATQWLANGATPHATTAGTWNALFALYMGANITGGVLLPIVGFQYQWI
jgi:hypothetical protein